MTTDSTDSLPSTIALLIPVLVLERQTQERSELDFKPQDRALAQIPELPHRCDLGGVGA